MPELDSADPRWRLVQQVVQSVQFEKSPKLRSFLLFVCERELTDHRTDINEHEIGVRVFGRAVGYNPGDDSIVRSQARILRQRLAEYFTSVGADATMHIEIPKGTYVPMFKVADAGSSGNASLSVKKSFASSLKEHPGQLTGSLVLLAVLAIVASWGGYRLLHSQRQTGPEERFWNTVFGTKRTAVIVPADSTLVLIEELTGTQVNFEDYQSRRYLANPALNQTGGKLTAGDLEESHYTSMADLNLVARLMAAPQMGKEHALIRHARDLSISDAREDNLILIGGARANPWVQLFGGRMNFAVDYDWARKENTVVNKTPQQGESGVYLQDPSDPEHRVYGLVAYEPSLDGEGDSLLVAGTSSAGTQAAADFLLSSHLFADFLRQIQAANGSIPHFELLLSARDLNGNVAGSTIVASRVAH